jgi:hypothetical protein
MSRQFAVLAACPTADEHLNERMQSPCGLELTREEAAAQLWSLALKHRHTCLELSKTNYVDIASRLLDTGLPEEQHVASGLLAVMADDEEFSNLQLLLRTTTEARVSSFIKRSFHLECPHDRSKVRYLTYSFHGQASSDTPLATVSHWCIADHSSSALSGYDHQTTVSASPGSPCASHPLPVVSEHTILGEPQGSSRGSVQGTSEHATCCW